MVLITGIAGFIGFHLAKRLLDAGYGIIGLDSINNYYDPELKFGRLKELGLEKRQIVDGELVISTKYPKLKFIKANLEDYQTLEQLFKTQEIHKIVNLAAQPGVRYSIDNPQPYVYTNLVGFLNILEISRHYQIKHLVYASSSSVYGLNEQVPFAVSHNVDHPVSLYAASKKSNELMAHAYSHLYNIPTTGLRFFTVYGPWGRPDMALFLFTKAILEGKSIQVFNQGNLARDFTYIDDIVSGIEKVLEKIPQGNADWSGEHPDPSTSKAPYKLYNIGNGSPVKLMDFIAALENELGIQAHKEFIAMQPGDVYKTWADCTDLQNDFNYMPNTSIQQGIAAFVTWYKSFYKN